MDGFNQGCPGGRGNAISRPRPKPGPPFLTAASPQTPLPTAPFLLSGLLSVLCPAFCDLIFFPSVHLFSIYHPLFPAPTSRAPRGLPEAGSPAQSISPALASPQGRLGTSTPHPASPSTESRQLLAWLPTGEGVLLPCSPATAALRPPFIDSFMPTHSIREECWGLCQEPCTALCWGH